MLFKSDILDGIVAGHITLAFRRWRRPTVRSGGTLKTGAGVLRIKDVAETSLRAITDADARHAGYRNAADARHGLGPDDGRRVYRVAVAFEGADPRIALRNDDNLDAASESEIASRLARLDKRADGAWTLRFLRLIAENPGVLAATLAKRVGRERDAFKNDVRKLKNLGLTESLEIGYRISPRGRVVLDRLSRSGATR